jgi:predicted nucleic acid-binding protein
VKKLVLDASVAVKWFLRSSANEDHVDVALNLLEQSVLGLIQFVEPPHFVAEVSAVLARLHPGGALQNLNNLLALGVQVNDRPDVYECALQLAIRHRHHLFDTLYHAVALQTPGAILVTADHVYFNKARTEGNIAMLPEFIVT